MTWAAAPNYPKIFIVLAINTMVEHGFPRPWQFPMSNLAKYSYLDV